MWVFRQMQLLPVVGGVVGSLGVASGLASSLLCVASIVRQIAKCCNFAVNRFTHVYRNKPGQGDQCQSLDFDLDFEDIF